MDLNDKLPAFCDSKVYIKIIERFYSSSGALKGHGRYAYYGRLGGCLTTGNEDGAKHCAMNILYSLQHLGYVMPSQADVVWGGEAGPGPTNLDPATARRMCYPSEYRAPDQEPDASCSNDERRRGHPGAREPEIGVGRRVPVRLSESGLSVV